MNTIFDIVAMKHAAKTNIQKQKHIANVKAANPEEAAPSAVYEPAPNEQAPPPDMGSWMPLESDRELIERVRQAAGLTDQDNVRIFVVPKGQNRIQPGSVIIRPHTSPRAEQISLNISRSRGRLNEIEIGIYHEELTDDEKSRLKNSLRNDVRRYERALARERAHIATLPRSGWIIVERE